MNTAPDLFATPKKTPTHTVRIEFDGGTPCNIPKLGYGDGYGSYRINALPVVRKEFNEPMSANAAEINTLAAALEDLATQCDPTETKVLIVGDSEIALKWARVAAGLPRKLVRGSSKIKPNVSEAFRTAIERLKTVLRPYSEIETRWQSRVHSVATFGH